MLIAVLKRCRSRCFWHNVYTSIHILKAETQNLGSQGAKMQLAFGHNLSRNSALPQTAAAFLPSMDIEICLCKRGYLLAVGVWGPYMMVVPFIIQSCDGRHSSNVTKAAEKQCYQATVPHQVYCSRDTASPPLLPILRLPVLFVHSFLMPSPAPPPPSSSAKLP